MDRRGFLLAIPGAALAAKLAPAVPVNHFLKEAAPEYFERITFRGVPIIWDEYPTTVKMSRRMDPESIR